MTTTVVVMSPKPNHQNVRVRVFYPDEIGHPDAKAYSDVTLKEGESTTTYVHSGAAIVIEEVEKEPPAHG